MHATGIRLLPVAISVAIGSIVGTKLALRVGNKAIISDAKNWPPMEDMSLSGYQQKKVWINDGAGRFVTILTV